MPDREVLAERTRRIGRCLTEHMGDAGAQTGWRWFVTPDDMSAQRFFLTDLYQYGSPERNGIAQQESQSTGTDGLGLAGDHLPRGLPVA